MAWGALVSLLDVLRSGVAIADGITKPLQAVVTYERETPGPYGPTYAAPVQLHAIVDYKAVMVRSRSGEMSATRATITLLNVAEIVAATGGLGVGNDDKFTLPDGDSGPIIDITGFVDAGTTNPVATTVMLG